MRGYLLPELTKIDQQIVAICDVDQRQLDSARTIDRLGDARTYRDYRELLDKERDVDAVVVATPDHWHVPVSRAVLESGRHVYCEKPLAHSVAECRVVEELAKKDPSLATQTGNQGCSTEGFRRAMEVIRSGRKLQSFRSQSHGSTLRACSGIRRRPRRENGPGGAGSTIRTCSRGSGRARARERPARRSRSAAVSRRSACWASSPCGCKNRSPGMPPLGGRSACPRPIRSSTRSHRPTGICKPREGTCSDSTVSQAQLPRRPLPTRAPVLEPIRIRVAGQLSSPFGSRPNACGGARRSRRWDLRRR